jgi:hypothetical protein
MNKGNGKKKRIAELKIKISEKNLMNRFIRQIEMEEPMEQEIMQMMLGVQLVPVR